MCDQIRHRGPDDEGYYVSGSCALGMRRLSIVDLHSGHQPISNEDGSVWVVFNGEIYNHRELRQRLEARGHRFRTNTDTETLVHLYEDEGVDGISRLRGMFAYALWDERQKKLSLVRDRFGKKPLYYALRPDGLWFGSELKCIQAAGIPLSLDRDALRFYFQFAYIPDPLSVYREVRKLEAGSWLTYGANGAMQQGRYWRLPLPDARPTAERPRGQLLNELRDAFDEAVRIRMSADVPIGAFLSGGIDSGSIVASMARQSGAPIKTFSIGFDEPEHSEIEVAAQVARVCATDHKSIIVRPDAVRLVDCVLQSLDEPFGDSSVLPTFVVSEAAAQHVKVVLSGDGGDEMFFGYGSLALLDRSRRFDCLPLALRRLIRKAADRLPYSFYGKNYLRMVSRSSPIERYFDLNYAPSYMREALLQHDWQLPGDNAYLLRHFADSLGPGDTALLSRVAYFEATTQLTSDMLVKVDRMSMANSIEVRCPLLDHKLAELAMTIPITWQMGEHRGKRFFIEAVGDRLPPEVLRRPKTGFRVPLASWFRGPLRTFLWDHVTSPSFLSRGIVSEPFLRVLLSEHDSGRRDNHHWLWSLLVLELWFRKEHDARVGIAA